MKYQAIELTIDDNPCIGARFTDGEFEGFEFAIHNVSLEETDDNAILHFEYDVINHPELSEDSGREERFRQKVGDLILHLLEQHNEQPGDGEDSFETVE